MQGFREIEKEMLPIYAALSVVDVDSDAVTEMIANFIEERESRAIAFLLLMTERCAELIKVDADIPNDRTVTIGGFWSKNDDEQDHVTKACTMMLSHIVEHHINDDWAGVIKHILEACSGGTELVFPMVLTAATMFRKVSIGKGTYVTFDADELEHEQTPMEFFQAEMRRRNGEESE